MNARRLLLLALMLGGILPVLRTQEQPSPKIRTNASDGILITPTGEPMILAVADMQQTAAEKSAELTDAIKTFNQVLWEDLSFSGFFTMAGKSFYPPYPIVRPEDVKYEDWSGLPTKVTFLTAGTLDLNGGMLRAELRIFDMKLRTMSFGQRISGNMDQVRAIAHRWADEIVYRLTAGASMGIARTKIAYSSRRGNAKEIYVMDYDGFNQQAFTHNGSNNLFPSWGGEDANLAFVSYRTGKPEINIYSYKNGSRFTFPQFNTFASTPAISPDGKRVVFSLRTPRGDADLFISNLDGSDRHNITNNPAIDTSPTWAPSGRQIAFASDRAGGSSQIFICDADGSNIQRIIKEGGDADSPAWSPDGKWLAFHWKPHLSTNYDIFIAEIGSGKIRQLTSSGGSDESPGWAPDGRHIAFQSNRNGTTQIYIMLLDGSQLRMITNQGSNTSPAWGGYFRREPDN
jgi:TolB protein